MFPIGLLQASKIIKNLVTALHTHENILYFDEDFGNVVFKCNEIGILNTDLDNINLDNSFYEDDPGTVIHVRILALHIKFEKRKELYTNRCRINACCVTSQ